MAKRDQPWGEAHMREGFARIHEIEASNIRESPNSPLLIPDYSSRQAVAGTEAYYRVMLRWARCSPARIEREVRRVRDLAEGRWVRDTSWRVAYPDGTASAWGTAREAHDAAAPNKWRRRAIVIRITRTCRVPR